MLAPLLPSFVDEFEKLAEERPLFREYRLASMEKQSAKSLTKKVEEHHAADKKDWTAFEKNMRSPRFTSEVLKSTLSDEKLKAYTQANNQYQRSKSVVLQIPSRTTDKMYTIKKLPGGRLGCSCKDWQYKRSWQGSDCEHVRSAKKGIEKVSSMALLARGAGLGWHMDQAKKQVSRGRESSQNVKAVRAAMGVGR